MEATKLASYHNQQTEKLIMTKENYSIQGLKDLLDELENLATCLIALPKDRVDKNAWNKMLEDQFELVQEAAAYANMLKVTEK